MDKNVNNQCFCNKLKKGNNYQNVKHMHVNVFIYFATETNKQQQQKTWLQPFATSRPILHKSFFDTFPNAKVKFDAAPLKKVTVLQNWDSYFFHDTAEPFNRR
jgi:hypothetical protein